MINNTNRFKVRAKKIYDEKIVEGYLCFVGDTGKINCQNDFCSYHVYVNTIEQCTGLTDKKGNLIFEGDIVFLNGEKWVVVWNDESCAFFFSNLRETYHQPIYSDLYFMANDFEVIGNIHENKELLK